MTIRKTVLMSALRHALLLGTVAAATLGAAGPVGATTPEETKAFVEKAVAHIKQVGPENAYADFSRPDGGFVQGDLYMFCYGFDGMNKAHGANPAFVGKNLIGLKDPDGFQVNVEIIKLAQSKGEGWIDFKWPNPLSKKIEAKSAFIVKVNDAVCGSGYYKG